LGEIVLNKNKVFTVIMAIFFLASMGGLVAQIAIANRNVCKDVTIKSIQRHIELPDDALIVSKKALPGVCELIVKKGDSLSTYYATSDFVISGEMFIQKSSHTLFSNKEVISKEFLRLRTELDAAAPIYYKPPGEIKHSVYMFENPDCYYCKDALSKIRKILHEHHADLRILFLASGEARLKSIDVACRNMNLDAFIEELFMPNSISRLISCEKGSSLVDKSNSLAKKLFVKNVPAFFIETGQMVQGDDLKLLEELLKNTPSEH
jgi:hypothetical protein